MWITRHRPSRVIASLDPSDRRSQLLVDRQTLDLPAAASPSAPLERRPAASDRTRPARSCIHKPSFVMVAADLAMIMPGLKRDDPDEAERLSDHGRFVQRSHVALAQQSVELTTQI